MTGKKEISIQDNFAQWVEERIKAFIAEDESNRLVLDGEVIYDEPLVGFARGDDPLFRRYKTIIGKFHYTPLEWMKLALGKKSSRDLRAKDLRVIGWILPIAERTRIENRMEVSVTSRRWAHTRLHGEECNQALRSYVVSLLQEKRYLAMAPYQSTYFATLRDDRVGISSNWSERHAVYAAGLGTFGLSDGLITSKGKAMRCGSVITNLPAEPTPRTFRDRGDYCPFYREGTCGECISRCPVGAITKKGHDKDACRTFVHEQMRDYIREHYDIEIHACGLCQTGVPCEFGIPE